MQKFLFFMDRAQVIYAIYVVCLAVFLGLMLFTPILALSDEKAAAPLYSAFAYTCHQKISRSECIFPDNTIRDCTNQSGTYVSDDRRNISAHYDSIIGYKLPVCARDVGIYLFMLLGAIIYPFIFKLDNKKILPPLLLVLAIAPLALDGSLQLLSDMGINLLGFPYESTNMIRLLTGAIAGTAVTFYVIPIANRMFN